MIKKEMYPKTKRMKIGGDFVQITEKLDGSNLVIFKRIMSYILGKEKYIFISRIRRSKNYLL